MSSQLSFSDQETLFGENEAMQFENFDEPFNHKHCSRWHFLAVSCSVWGMQLFWCTVFARGTPYLLSLGIPKSATPLLWIAGPLCGVVIQPLAGTLSDNFQPRPGCSRRKPFIAAGAFGTVVSMMGLALIEESVTIFNITSGQGTLRFGLAIFWVYALNVSIQPLQGGIRTLLFESCAPEQQVQAASWYSVSTALGNVCGFFLASLSLREAHIPILSKMSQFQALCTIISMLLLAATFATCFLTKEKVILSHSKEVEEVEGLGLVGILTESMRCLQSLPAHIKLVLQIQFFAWLGWFPVIYYQTSYLADLYTSQTYAIETNGEVTVTATQRASLAAISFALVSLLSAVILALFPFKSRALTTDRSSSSSTGTLLINSWLIGHALFVCAMLSTIFISTITQGTVAVAIIGLSWTLSSWVPFALVGDEIARSSGHAGTINSLHNAAISAPQILAAIMCALLFQLSKWIGRSDNTVWTLWLAGFATTVAGWKTFRLRKHYANNSVF